MCLSVCYVCLYVMKLKRGGEEGRKRPKGDEDGEGDGKCVIKSQRGD